MYYQFVITLEGKRYCDKLSKEYSEYMTFLSKNIPNFPNKFYVEPLESST